jgi:RNA polymerase sigma factor (sigma-70 family)
VGRLWNFSACSRHYQIDVDDIELLERARRGDEPAFSRLFAGHQRTVYRYAAHMCGRDQADDIVQETFLVVLRQGERRDAPRGAVGAYLLGIARHLVLKRLGAKYDARAIESLEARDEREAPLGEAPTVLEALTRAEMIDAIRTAIAGLPAAYREAVVLCELEELDYAAAAGVMQCPIGTVRSRLHRARGLLATTLAELSPAAQGSRR